MSLTSLSRPRLRQCSSDQAITRNLTVFAYHLQSRDTAAHLPCQFQTLHGGNGQVFIIFAHSTAIADFYLCVTISLATSAAMSISASRKVSLDSGAARHHRNRDMALWRSSSHWLISFRANSLLLPVPARPPWYGSLFRMVKMSASLSQKVFTKFSLE